MVPIPLFSPRTNQVHELKREAQKRIKECFVRLRDAKNKTEMIMACDANVLLFLCRDNNHATLSEWDPEHRVRDRSQYRDTDVKELDHSITLQGTDNIVWWRYDDRKKSYTVIHCTLQGPLQFEGYWFQVLRTGNCFVQTNRGIDVLRYLLSVTEHSEVQKVFQNWTCEYCSIVVPSSSLACSKCLRPRYWICANAECEWPQTRDAVVCRNCQAPRTTDTIL